MLIGLCYFVLRLRWQLMVLTVSLIVSMCFDSAYAQANPCSSGSSSSYTVTVCIAQTDNMTVSELHTVTATVIVSGANPGIADLIFQLDGSYLLTDTEAPYIFELPTNTFPNGEHILSVQANMLDGYTTTAAATLRFSNDSSPPAGPEFTAVAPGVRPPGQSLIMAATGDGAGGETNARLVAQLVDSWNPDVFLYLGDVYDKGTYTEFHNWYGDSDSYFGLLRDVTNPIIGNHEYENGSASGYFAYWNNVSNYYSYNAGGWHFIALNSTGEYNQTDANSPQYQWLLNDLATNNTVCSVAYFHHPVLSVGPEGGTPRMNAVYNRLARYGVDIILAGHDHNYQRWLPLDANLNPREQGLTQFVAGAGGHGVQEITSTDTRLAVAFGDPTNSYGALYFKLNPKGAEYRYVNIQGQVLDQGVIPCSGAAPDNSAPVLPADVTATTSSSGHIALSWNPAWDETGVAGYSIYRNGRRIATLEADKTAYVDFNVGLGITYHYEVDAVDSWGNRSAKSNRATIARPAEATLRFYPTADTYVQSVVPDANYGTATMLKVDGVPDTQSFLRFKLQGIDGTITSATLRIYAITALSSGYQVHPLTSSEWAERDVVYANKPTLGAPVATSGGFTAGSWTQVDLRSLVAGNGQLDIAITTDRPTAVNFSSCEGVMPPQLIIETSSSGQAAEIVADGSQSQSDPPLGDFAIEVDSSFGQNEQRPCPYILYPIDLSFGANSVFLPIVYKE